MVRQWSRALGAVFVCGIVGCATTARQPESALAGDRPGLTSDHPPDSVPVNPPIAGEPGPVPAPPELTGPQPVDAFIRRALAENRTVQAAYHNVQSLRHRIPQVTTRDDPVISNTVFPIPSVAPQYFLMGYNPYNWTLAQQFPWFGVLRLRGEVAEKDVQVALAELAAAQLDAVAAVKRAYHDLYASQRTEEILTESRTILEVFRDTARQRLPTGGAQQDVLRSEVLINDLDRELAGTQQGIASARAALARQVHVSPEADLRTLPELSAATVPTQIERLDRLALAARPELQGRLASIARDEKAVELARKRFYPDLTLGLTYMDMQKTNAVAPQTASGSPNVGLFVGFNLPVHQRKYRAGVCEAQERALADAKLYEAQQDEAYSEIQDFLVQARVQQNVLGLLREQILPRTRKSLNLARSEYSNSVVDLATVLSALREVLQVQVQIVQVEAELGKALAALERAVGYELKEHPPASATSFDESTAPEPPPQPPATSSPFRLEPPGDDANQAEPPDPRRGDEPPGRRSH
jgi:outer membrane protein TolC